MDKKYIVFILKRRFRRASLLNILKIGKIKEFRIIDFSGPIKYVFFYKILSFFLFFFKKYKKNFIFISCDGFPLIKDNGVNLWFGGSNLKIPNEYKNLKNNCPLLENFISRDKNFFTFYPSKFPKIKIDQNFKIIYAANIDIKYNDQIKNFWEEKKDSLLNHLSLIDSKDFWEIFPLKSEQELNRTYISIKNLLRIEIIKKIYKEFPEELIIIGNDWKNYITTYLPSTSEKNLKNFYFKNVCLDFGSKWSDHCMYPRSIDIVESGGFLVQSKQIDSEKIFGELKNLSTFDSVQGLIKLLHFLKNNNDEVNFHYEKIYKNFSNENLNYQTLKKIFEISKK